MWSESGRVEESLAYYERAYRDTGGMPAIARKLADLNQKLGRPDKAQGYLDATSAGLEEKLGQRRAEGLADGLSSRQLMDVHIDQVRAKIAQGEYQQANELLNQMESDADPKLIQDLRGQIRKHQQL